MLEVIKLEQYNIYLGDIWSAINTFVKNGNYTKVYIITDDNTSFHCLPPLEEFADFPYSTISIEPGELSKHIESCIEVWSALKEYKADRNCLVINLGGGMICDLGGFCAATYLRGVDFVHVPTTLLAQVDASIGGKLGVDLLHLKNIIGLFKDPKAVFVHPGFLTTLSERELKSGWAEIIKHGLICDKNFWEELLQIIPDSNINWLQYIIPSIKIKKNIVEEDPKEKGKRKLLNFGHTAGHAIESFNLESENPLLHGEAVAIGLVIEAYLSHLKGSLSETEVITIKQYVHKIYGIRTILPVSYDELIFLMLHDKKNKGGKINFTFLDSIGKGSINHTASSSEIIEALDFYQNI